MSKAYVMKRTGIDAYLTEFHPAGKRSDRPIAIGAVQLPYNDQHPWHGEQVFKTYQDALEALKGFLERWLDEPDSDWGVYEIQIDWDEDTYIGPMMEYLEGKPNYHLHNPALIVRKCNA